MTKKLIKTNPGRWAVFSMIMAVFLLAACGDTATPVPGNTSAGASAAAVSVNNNSGAMMGQTSGAMMGNTTPGTGKSLTVAEAKEAVTGYLNKLGNKDLVIDEIMTVFVKGIMYQFTIELCAILNLAHIL